MSFDVEASTTIVAPRESVFRVLCDFGSWARWMPPSFTPAEWTSEKLSAGKILKIKIGYLPIPQPVEVYTVDPYKEITWGGGSPKLLTARHRFLFEDADGGKKTLVRSVETWEGGAERFLKPIVSRAAAAIGKAQLAALKRECER